MGLFSTLKNAIFGNTEQDKQLAEAAKPINPKPGDYEPEPVQEPVETAAAPVSEAVEQVEEFSDCSDAEQYIHVSETSEPAAPRSQVDVAAELDAMAKAHPEDLDWKRSIVDLMKLVGMDSSYSNRKEMAIELGYSKEDIESKGSAEMNMWLHKQVLAKLAEDSAGDTSRLMV